MRQKSFILIIFFCLACVNNASSQENLYNMNDLNVLQKDKSFIEFFQHAKDIRPGLRDDNWHNLVKNMSMEMLDKIQKKNLVSETDFNLVKKISEWSSLKNDEFFLRKRNLVAIKYYSNCSQSLKWEKCYQEILDFYKKNDQNAELGVGLAKALYNQNPVFKDKKPNEEVILKYDLWPLVATMAKSSIGEFYCAKEPMQTLIINKLYQKVKDNNQFNPNAFVHKDCFKVLIPNLKANLLSSNNTYIRSKTFHILNRNSTINIEDRSQFYLMELLDGTNNDKQQTLKSFEVLKQLSNNEALRSKILNRLEGIIPLPGKVFSLESNSAKAITSGLSRYIPEYIDFYASTCLNHLSGIAKTEGGNPATYCHEFYKMAQKSNLIPKYKLIQYNKLMNSWKK